MFEGKWCCPIQSSESFWVLEQKETLLLSLEKKKETWWDCLLQGDPTIDTTKVSFIECWSELVVACPSLLCIFGGLSCKCGHAVFNTAMDGLSTGGLRRK